MRSLRFLLLFGAVLFSSVSCRSAEPKPEFVPSGCIRCVMTLVPKNSMLVLETRITREHTVGQNFSTTTQRIPPLVLKPGEWNELSLKQTLPTLERLELVMDGKREQFLYPVQGIYLRVFTEKQADGSYRLKGFFRSAAFVDGIRKMEVLATPFSATLFPGGEKAVYKLEY